MRVYVRAFAAVCINNRCMYVIVFIMPDHVYILRRETAELLMRSIIEIYDLIVSISRRVPTPGVGISLARPSEYNTFIINS